MNTEILQKAKYWSEASCFDSSTHEEILPLIEKKDETELTNRFYKDLEFGTGGMRGIMGAGTARFNVYNVKRASEALAQYLKSLYREPVKIALSYDSRHHSRLFAETAVSVFASHGIRSYLTKEMRPVPMLSFMVRHFKCHAGVCITASHNPPEYNGYKIYWKCGGQLTPPHDKEILRRYEELSDYSLLPDFSLSQAREKNLVEDVLEDLDSAYISALKTLSSEKANKKLKIVYSPLHGSGIYAVPQALKAFGFEDLHVVKDQEKPDGRFPTVASPNPEDPKALVLAKNLALEINADLVLATDPDADRLAVVVREGSSWKSFNGNEMGALIFNYRLQQLKEKGQIPDNAFTVKTTVTSNLLKRISESYGIPCEETLTGFKWICHRIEAYESGSLKPYKKFLCGAEESFGYLVENFVRDKDAVLASAFVAEMLYYYKEKEISLSSVLEDLYLQHGFYHEHLETITLPGKDGSEKIKEVMRSLRENKIKRLGTSKVQTVRDYKDSSVCNLEGDSFKKSSDIELPKSDVIEFLGEDCSLTVRPSGTEPKLKIYISLWKDPKGLKSSDLKILKEKSSKYSSDLIREFKSSLNV